MARLLSTPVAAFSVVLDYQDHGNTALVPVAFEQLIARLLSVFKNTAYLPPGPGLSLRSAAACCETSMQPGIMNLHSSATSVPIARAECVLAAS